MNYRKLFCNKDIMAIGQENSISDNKNKLNQCFKCYQFIFCEGSKKYLQELIKQTDIIKKLDI